MRRLMFLLVACLALIFGTPVYADWQTGFESPDYNGSAGGTPLTDTVIPPTGSGQQGWYLPVAGSNIFNVFTYAGNTYGISQNPQGGSQFVGGRMAGNALMARAQRDYAWADNDSWTITFDVAALYTGVLPAVDNLGSFSLQPSTTAKYWQYILTWQDVNTATAFRVGYLTAENGTAPGVFPGPEWQNLPVNHWYQITTTFRLSNNKILECKIKDLNTGVETVFQPPAPGWHLLQGTLPTPTGMRFFTGGGAGTSPAGNFCAYDNLSVVLGPPPPTGGCCTGAACAVLTELECADITGTYIGDNTTCTPNPCVGACCIDDTGICTNNVARADCEAQGGRFAASTLCANLNPPCGTGACCYGALNAKQCADYLSEPACLALTNGEWQGPGSRCSTSGAPCNRPCCLTDGTCLITDQVYCEGGLGGIWLTNLDSCTPYPCPPPNDECGNLPPPPTLVSGVPVTFTGTNINATVGTDCVTFATYPNVWQAFTLPNCMDVTLDLCGSANTTGGPFSGVWAQLAKDCSPECAATPAACDQETTLCGDSNVTLTWPHLPAGTYYYPIVNASAARGNYALHVVGTNCASEPPVPPNDNCAAAIAVTMGTPAATGDNSNATDDGTASCVADTHKDVWYKYTATATQPVIIDTLGSTQVDTVLAVFSGCGSTELACNDDIVSGVTRLSSLQLNAVSGTTYWIRVASWASCCGGYHLNIKPGCATCKADLNGDGQRNGVDVQLFVNCVLAGGAPAGCACADMNGDGIVDLTDLTDPTVGFVTTLINSTGACP